MVDPVLKIGNDVFTVSPMLAEASFLLQPKLLPILPDIAELYGIFTQAAAAVLMEIRSGEPEQPVDDATQRAGGAPAAAETTPAQVAAASQVATDYIARASGAIARACGKLPPEEMRYIMRQLLQGATMNGTVLYQPQAQANPIDVLMRGRTIDIWRLLAHSVQVSYPDFFDLARGLRARVAPAGSSAK